MRYRIPLILALLVLLTRVSVAQQGKKLVYSSGTQSMTRVLTGVNETIPGEFTTPCPTLHNIAVEWDIEGDDNLNGVVKVQYRKTGVSQWHKAMDLRRVPKMAFNAGPPKTSSIFHWDNKHSGSILGLEPDTEYEIRCRLYDPDGGEAEHSTRVRTRPVPGDMPNAPVIPVTPETFQAARAKARPGDVLLMAPGHNGYLVVKKNGEPGKPIVFRADPFDYRERDRRPQGYGHRAFVIFDGVSLQGRKYVHLEGVLSTNTIDLFNAESCAVTRCIVSGIYGIISSQQGLRKKSPDVYARLQPSPDESRYIERGRPRTLIPPHATNCYIADNILIGVNQWLPRVIHAGGKNVGEGIQFSGPGNVVCYNKVIGFRDCISIMENRYAENQSCIDIYNNDIYSGSDDGIEVDYIFHNCRIERNRITNCMRGIAVAPVLGGPAYLVRNVLYNTEFAWQLGRVGSGYVAVHNSSVKKGDAVITEPQLHALVKNNIFLGAGPKALAVRTWGKVRAHLDYDYNGYGLEGAPFAGTLAGVAFDSEASLRANTMEKHGMRLGVKDFAAPIRVPADLFPAQLPQDLRLHAESPAVDAGVVIPTINDDFTGAAPDLGAYELGQAVPHYGPRGLLDK